MDQNYLYLTGASLGVAVLGGLCGVVGAAALARVKKENRLWVVLLVGSAPYIILRFWPYAWAQLQDIFAVNSMVPIGVAVAVAIAMSATLKPGLDIIGGGGLRFVVGVGIGLLLCMVLGMRPIKTLDQELQFMKGVEVITHTSNQSLTVDSRYVRYFGLDTSGSEVRLRVFHIYQDDSLVKEVDRLIQAGGIVTKEKQSDRSGSLWFTIIIVVAIAFFVYWVVVKKKTKPDKVQAEKTDELENDEYSHPTVDSLLTDSSDQNRLKEEDLQESDNEKEEQEEQQEQEQEKTTDETADPVPGAVTSEATKKKQRWNKLFERKQ